MAIFINDAISNRYEDILVDFQAYCHANDLVMPDNFEATDIPFWFVAMLVDYYKNNPHYPYYIYVL